MSFQDKLKPINATSTPNFQAKLKPVTQSNTQPTPLPAPQNEKGFLGTKKNDSLYGKVIDNSVTRGIQKFFPGQKVGQAIGTLAGYGIAKAKGNDEYYDLSAPTPLQVAGDVAKGTAMIAGLKAPVPKAPTAIKTIGNSIVQGAKYGAIAGGGQSAIETSDNAVPTLKDALQVAKGSAVGGLVGGAVSGAVSATGQLLSKAGEKIMNSTIRPSQADIKDGFSMETVKKYELGGSLNKTYTKTETLLDDLSTQLNQKLTESPATINLNDVYEETAKRLKSNNLSTFGSNSRVDSALDLLRNELDNLDDISAVNLSDANVIKRASGHYGAWTYGQVDPDATARQTVFNVFYNELKKTIEKSSPEGVQEINKQLSELIPVMNAVIRRIPVAERNNLLSLTDIITLSASALDPRALGSFAVNLASKSGTVGNLLNQVGMPIQRSATPLGTVLGGGAGALSNPEQQ